MHFVLSPLKDKIKSYVILNLLSFPNVNDTNVPQTAPNAVNN